MLLREIATLPFEVVVVDYGGKKREACRYICVECGENHKDFLIHSGDARSATPNAHFKKLLSKGWKKHRGEVFSCPECNTGQDEQPTATVAEDESNIVDCEFTQDEGLTPMNQMTAYVTAPEMTHDLRLKVRSALDTNFDDAKGMYLDGMSDAKIAEHLKIPRTWVETIRETAYGPIRITPEVLGLKNDLMMALNSLGDLTNKFDQLKARLEAIEKGM